MSVSHKQDFIKAFFDDFGRRIERLPKLYGESFRHEAFILGIVYINWLASGYYGGEPGGNRKSFCRALNELSGNALFGMIHPRELIERADERCPFATSLLESIVKKQPRTLLSEAELTQEIQASSMADSEKDAVISNVWRASIANICYDHIRNPEIHGPGSGGLSFGDSMYEGKVGVSVDFRILYDALRKIHGRIMAISIEKGEWFGRPSYMCKRL
jgi:hypothetical protein